MILESEIEGEIEGENSQIEDDDYATPRVLTRRRTTFPSEDNFVEITESSEDSDLDEVKGSEYKLDDEWKGDKYKSKNLRKKGGGSDDDEIEYMSDLQKPKRVDLKKVQKEAKQIQKNKKDKKAFQKEVEERRENNKVC